MIVKICGLRTIEHALVAAMAGADMIGLVFAPSRRQVDLDQARAIAVAVRSLSRPVLLVGLFVNAPPEQINTTVDIVGLDLVQLSGDEPASYAAQIARPLFKSVRLAGNAGEQEWLALAASYSTAAPPAACIQPLTLLVDAHVPGAYGGTGARADWSRASELARRLPIMLAGGLDPENVAAAIVQVRPWGVDVSSGVEIAGVKDPAKIEEFIAAAREVR